MRQTLLPLVLAAALGCASAPPPLATEAVDWNAVAATGTPEIVTRTADGGEKVRKIWIVVMERQGYVRTGQSSWLADIQRDSNVVLRIDGAAYPLRAVPVVDRSLRDQINRSFREKYGVMDFLIHPFGAPGANILALVEP